MPGSNLRWLASYPGGSSNTSCRFSCRNLILAQAPSLEPSNLFDRSPKLRGRLHPIRCKNNVLLIDVINLICYLGSKDESRKTVHQAEFSLLLAELTQRFPHNSSVSSLLAECVKNNRGVIIISDGSTIN